MVSNVEPATGLGSLARSRAKRRETKTVSLHAAEEHRNAGWEVEKENRKSLRLGRLKSHGAWLEDRVWTLLYRMKFEYLSANGGAQIQVTNDPAGPKTQIDVVGMDAEVALAIECKSCETLSRRPQFQQELGKHALIRDRFTAAARNDFEPPCRRLVALAMLTSNILLSENDKTRAREANIVLFDEHDLEYYENLVNHIGPAARYQFLAEIFPGKTIPNLEIKVPAIRTKMGGSSCYTFSISPEYLLKIAYVSHRAKGRASDVDTYQRMVNKGRLNKIRQYIEDDGIFPTNIVLNLDKTKLTFQRSAQEQDASIEHGIAGWLNVRATYKCAWVIDGQHRLFAYSGHPKAEKSRVAVLAFEGLVASEQARLFIDINAKQKSVRQSLLQELYAELHWDADDPTIRARAIVSKAVQDLDSDPTSPLFQRIQTADATKSETRCITLNTIYSAVEKTEFLIGKVRQNHVLEFGPLWAGDNHATLRRTTYILKEWFNSIRSATPDWWDKGAGDGGGLAMNDGITTCIMVLRSVFQQHEGDKLIALDDEDLFEYIRKYAQALGGYFARMSEQDRKTFRSLRGVQGQTRRWRKCQEAIRAAVPRFNPEGLDKYLMDEKAQTNVLGKKHIDEIEKTLQRVIIDELRREMPDGDDWWTLGVPKQVRLKVMQKYEEDDAQRGGKEFYFDLIEYQKIAQHRWELFQPILGYGSGSKEKQLSWMNFVNARRNEIAHVSSGKTLTLEQFNELERYAEWLADRISNLGADQEEANSASD